MATNKSKTTRRTGAGKLRKVFVTIALVIAVIISGGVAVVTIAAVVNHTSGLRSARDEYANLRAVAADLVYGGSAVQLSELDIEMLAVNPDYVAWLRISGTDIDYPVVRAHDNERYLNTSFSGEESDAGTVFMDFRNIGNFISMAADDFVPHIILYGHLLRQGGMFSELHSFLNERFSAQNHIITLTINGEEVNFEIFDVRLTDVYDYAYFINFSEPHAFHRFADRVGAPLAATQILTLSTCTFGNNDDERLVVQAHRLFS